ncbi:DUF305 domain-containing protein [Williamsia sp.]|uniref:DUF305 domain-containing protein n=1 Tax=Williamsia sp. TaxID=1872085 RepID=UPI002F91D51A
MSLTRSTLPTTRSARIKIAASGLGVAATLVLAGCSDDGGHDMNSMSSPSVAGAQNPAESSANAADHNSADVMFAQMMYPHHAQAVEMAALVEGRSDNPRIIVLARAIENAQGPEMEQLERWLTQWGQPAPDTDTNDMDHGDHGMSGMMTAQDMSDLASSTGAEFDQVWLSMMIEHHAGAIEMADTVIADGLNPAVDQMATAIVATQQAEIDTMRSLQTAS